jgi:hypothetical protein
MDRIAKKVEVVANMAIIIAATVFAFVAIRHYTGTKSGVSAGIAAGEHLVLTDVNWSANKRNVVLALSVGCHFCTESAPFYRELIHQCKLAHIRTIAVLPQSGDAAHSYLSNLQISVDEMRNARLPDIGIAGTPTLLLVSDQGVVQNVWVGELPHNAEKEVLGKLGS